ncbi:uncharacterized protein LOC111640177 [Centruroides sculpturatus]|uniref:uncharacterized protein LOC111640177 n=1 Tax=Centruroides sculpturatus TaxID=218467 RepID=UPI000C6E3EC7|nr:uncharacterized protein LOC111640177 [Centruroides sculpturatus]
MILQLELSFVLITYSADFQTKRCFNKSIPSKFIQKEYVVHVVKEDTFFKCEMTFFYKSGNRQFPFTEEIMISTFIEVEKSYAKICKNHYMNSCKMYNRTKTITEKKSLIPKKMTVVVHLEDWLKQKKSFVMRYIYLLTDVLHTKCMDTLFLHQADIAINRYLIRKTYVTYSSSVTHIPTTFAIRAARPLEKTLILTKPFDIMIWICIPFSFFVVLITLYGIMKKESEYRKKEIPKFSTLFWIILRHFVRQDTTIDNYIFTTFRILVGCWILIAFILTSAYVGTLPSFMVNPGTETIPQTFQELIQSVKAGRYNITFFRDSDECLYFDRCSFYLNYKMEIVKNEMIDIFNENVRKFDESDFFNSNKQIKKVLSGTHAVLATKHEIESSLTKEQKEKVFISEDILFTKFLFVQMSLVRVNYADKISKLVNIFAQSGIAEKINRDLVEEKTRKDLFYYDHKIDTDNDPLKVDDIMGLLYLLVTGYIISFLVFLTEILVNKINKIKKRKCRVRQFNIVN